MRYETIRVILRVIFKHYINRKNNMERATKKLMNKFEF